MTLVVQQPGVALGVVRGVSYGLFRAPEPFLAEARALGAGLVRIYLYWSQIEPEPGRYRFDVVDRFLAELDGSASIWITVSSSSRWATRVATDFLPPSPAKDPAAYERFVRQLVGRCAGRVRYWQCDNEPCNVGLTWAGTAAEYVAQLGVMYRAVKDVDPGAAVVLGGAPHPLPASAPDSAERRFFDVLLRDGRDWFDLFDLHLYGDAARIPADVEMVRGLMRAAGYERPVVAGEHAGPTPDLFPEAMTAMQETLAAALAAPPPAVTTDGGGAQNGARQTPEQRALAALYARMPSLPPQLQMFMAGCPPELERKRHRINCRELVKRTLLALGAGVRVMAYWKLGPEVSGWEDPLSTMELFYGKLSLLGYEPGDRASNGGAGPLLRHRHPAARTFALLAAELRDADTVAPIDVADARGLSLYDVRRRGRGPLLVAWRAGDLFSGEDEPPAPFTWRWPAAEAAAIDALGDPVTVELRDGQATLPLSVTPVLITADRPDG